MATRSGSGRLAVEAIVHGVGRAQEPIVNRRESRRDLGAGLLAVTVLAVLLSLWMPVTDALTSAIGTALVVQLPGLMLLRAAKVAPKEIFARCALASCVGASVVALSMSYLAMVGLPLNVPSLAGISLLWSVLAIGVDLVRSPDEPDDRAVGRSVDMGSWLSGPGAIAVAGALLLPFLLAMRPAFGAMLLGVSFTLLLIVALRRLSTAITAGGANARREQYAVVLLLAAGLATLVGARVAMLAQSPAPLGYDTGFYRGTFREYHAALPEIPRFSDTAWGANEPPGLYLFADALHLSGWTLDAVLYGSLLGFQLLLAGGVWLLAKDIGGRLAGAWAVVLLALSAYQLEAYWFVYSKQLLAATLLLYTVWLWRRDSFLAVPVGALLAAAHHMTLLLAGLVLLTDFVIIDRQTRRDGRGLLAHCVGRTKRRQLGIGVLILLAGIPTYLANPEAIITYVPLVGERADALFTFGTTAGGTFAEPAQYFWLSLPIVPLALITAASTVRQPPARPVLVFAGWALLLVLLRAFFFRRYVVHLDLAVIVLAAPALAMVTRAVLTPGGGQRLLGSAVVAIVVAGSAATFVSDYRGVTPHINAEELRRIERLPEILPSDAFVLVPTPIYAPWMYGYSERPVLSFGLFEHRCLTDDEWLAFRRSSDPEGRAGDALEEIAASIYVYRGEREPPRPFEADPRFRQVAPNLWRFEQSDRTASPNAPIEGSICG